MLSQYHLYIHGDVTGVGFRAWSKMQAKFLSIKGWIRNVHDRPDRFGKLPGIEAIAQGNETNIQAFIELLRKGPPISSVTHLESFKEDPKEIFELFEIKK